MVLPWARLVVLESAAPVIGHVVVGELHVAGLEMGLDAELLAES
jgi:hypothetical protein